MDNLGSGTMSSWWNVKVERLPLTWGRQQTWQSTVHLLPETHIINKNYIITDKWMNFHSDYFAYNDTYLKI